MTEETALRLVEITQRKTNELFDELVAELRDIVGPFDTVDADSNIATDDRELALRPSGYDEVWSFDGIQLPKGDWMQMGDPVIGETYGWPDGSAGTYNPFVTYTGTGGKTGATFALGYESNGETIGFVVGANGSKRGLTVFWPADDIATSNEKLSMIKGGRPRGRSGFGPGDSLPDAYAGFNVEMLGERIAGKWNVQAVVAEAGDYKTMLNHTLLQARLRGLV
jgi:hypothetical protein